MTATVTTKEPLEKNIKKERLDEAIRLRIKAGAIRAWVEEDDDGSMLLTEWNVIGEQ